MRGAGDSKAVQTGKGERRMIRICCITYKDVDRLVREALESYQDKEVEFSIVEGLRTEILEEEKRKVIEGADVAIAAGANAQIAAAAFQIPVLQLRITDFDYLTAVEQGLKLGGAPAVVTYQQPISKSMKEYLQIIGREVENIVYEDTEELQEALSDSRADVIIGATHAVEVGKRLGRKTVLLYPSFACILDTIAEAKNLARELEKERNKNQYINGLLHCSVNGIFLVDSLCRVIDFNQKAVELAAIEREKLKYSYLDQILPNLKLNEFVWGSAQEALRIIRLGGKEMFCNIVRLDNRRSQFDGAVIMMYYLDELKHQIRQGEKEERQRKEKGFKAKRNFSDIIGSSLAIRRCIEDARFYAESESNLMVYGETGTGKEIFAQSVHNQSRRKNEAFIAVNCAALPENLLETELFGYDEGAFTGGRKGGKKGLFELADHGTLFLDEIGELSPGLQSRLLRVLQEKEIMHVGGQRIIPVDVRIIAATNKGLEQMDASAFRRDLLYRLNVLELNIPPLRERENDVAELFDFYYKKKRDMSIHQVELTEGAKEILKLYHWPGNIRELQNVCERFCLYLKQSARCSDALIRKCMIRAVGEERLKNNILESYDFREKGATPELVGALKRIFSYNREQIAKLLGISRTTLWRATKGEQE
ncbi:sigma 54-interacting transcriptional regulator [Otoolea muris]|uniref:sigma 54-interacting transcriptional regulator n=1 Tax=Otoolea muris TaxID=2941515 RepID=UPI00142977E3|nr:sigma 54-interacting transcriptional regulator [Otoolea muris]